MTDIKQKALALLNEVRSERGYAPIDHLYRTNPESEALCRAIEPHEAFRQEVSDAVMQAFPNTGLMPDCLGKLIIPKPKPDPLVEIIGEINDGPYVETKAEYADRLRAALDALGFEIREKNDG